MLVNVDVKSLELVTCADLSKDITLTKELTDKFDIHADNQEKFGLPKRVVAKRFVFKLIFGATAWGYVSDSDFIDVGYTEKQWQYVIDKFYEKYYGVKKWHDGLLIEVMRTGLLTIPSGRYFPYQKNGYRWPITTIKNYSVQGWGADLVKLARIEALKNIKQAGLQANFIQTIHDSLVFDVPFKSVDAVAKIVNDAVEAIPDLSEKYYGYRLSLPVYCEVLVGKNKREMLELVLT